MRSFIFCTHPPNIIRQIKSRRMRWAGHGGKHGRGDASVHGFGGKARRKEITWKIKGRWDQNGSQGDWLEVWSGLNRLRIGTGGGLL
jgi:hypothetical protein